MDWLGIGLTMLIVFVICCLSLLVISKRIVRGRSDELLVVTGKVGKGRNAKILHGGITFIWPIIQTYEWLPLTPVTINLTLTGALSKENIRVAVPCAIIVAVSSDNNSVIDNAVVRILSLIHDATKFSKFVEDIIFGQMRSVISSLTITEINSDRSTFQNIITERIHTELVKVGLQLISINIKDIVDNADYIENLGKKAAAEACSTASIAIAEQKKIGDTGSSKFDAERRKAVSQNELMAVASENEANVEIAKSNFELEKSKRELEAINLSKAQITISNSRAEASKIEAKNDNEVFQARLETTKSLEELRKAEARVEAAPLAEKLIIQSKAEGQSEGIKIKERLEKEAEGIKKILEARADGLSKIVAAANGNANAALFLLMSDRLPDILEKYAEMCATRKIDKLICIDGVNGKGSLGGLTNQFINSIPQLMEIGSALGLKIPTIEEKDKPEVTNE